MALDLDCGGINSLAPYIPVTERLARSSSYGINLNDILESDASDYVGEALDRSQDVSERYRLLAEQALAALGNFENIQVDSPEVDIDIDNPPDFDTENITAPTRPETGSVDTSGLPALRGEIREVSLNQIDTFDELAPDAPSETLDFSNNPYISPLLNRLQENVEDIIVNGGTGLSEEYEALVRERALSRSHLDHEKKRADAETFYAARGYTAPPGALIARVNMLNREQLRNDNLLNGEITAKLIEVADQHKRFMLDLGAKLEGMTIEQSAKANALALEASKAYVTVLYDAYGKRMEAYKIKAEMHKAKWETEEIRVKAIASGNESITRTYEAELKAYSTRVEAEIAIAEQIVKVYIAEVGGYEAAVKAEVARLEGFIETYKARLQAEQVKGTIKVEEFKALVQKAIAEVQLRVTSQQEVGRISAQIAASALSIFNASATISEGKSKSASYNEGRSQSFSESFSQGISESYAVSVGKSSSCNIGQTESFNYSASV